MTVRIKSVKKAKKANFVAQVEGMNLLGEIITWNARSEGKYKHVDVVAALTAADLDPAIAKEFLPRHAFTRACKSLSTERIIDIFKEEGANLIFQFTKKTLEESGWDFAKETFLTLNRDTGKVTCDQPELQELAQAELDRAMVVRTTSDITKIVQKLFDDHADLFPVRDQGGVYFVPQMFSAFVGRVELFLTKLGGNINRFPVPAGTQFGDLAVQNAIKDSLAHLIADHNKAVGEFSVNTRKDTIEAAADKIKGTRVKIEAYAAYLREEAAGLLVEVETANKNLLAQISKLAGEKAVAPVHDAESRLVFGHAMTAVVRWMGEQNWGFDEVKKVLVTKMSVPISDGTIKTQLQRGRKRSQVAAELTKDQVKQLNEMRKGE